MHTLHLQRKLVCFEIVVYFPMIKSKRFLTVKVAGMAEFVAQMGVSGRGDRRGQAGHDGAVGITDQSVLHDSGQSVSGQSVAVTVTSITSITSIAKVLRGSHGGGKQAKQDLKLKMIFLEFQAFKK